MPYIVMHYSTSFSTFADHRRERVMSSSREEFKYGFHKPKSFLIEDILGKGDSVRIDSMPSIIILRNNS